MNVVAVDVRRFILSWSRKSEPPYVGCYGSRGQRANWFGEFSPRPSSRGGGDGEMPGLCQEAPGSESSTAIRRFRRQQNLFINARAGPRHMQARPAVGVDVFNFDLDRLPACQLHFLGDFLAARGL